MMIDPYGPNARRDALPPHQNAIRRFREELRMDRPDFSELLDINIDTLRVWEAGKSKPRGEAALKIIAFAERNNYPLTITDIFPNAAKKKKETAKKK
jgi:DNA-binding XRE family transcriptional regulator